MAKVFIDTNYPKNMVAALKLIHDLEQEHALEIEWTTHFDGTTSPIALIFDRKSKDIDKVTEKHFKEGYRVFAFKMPKNKKLNFFELAWTVIRLWPKMVNQIRTSDEPFVFTYNYLGTKLKKVR